MERTVGKNKSTVLKSRKNKNNKKSKSPLSNRKTHKSGKSIQQNFTEENVKIDNGKEISTARIDKIVNLTMENTIPEKQSQVIEEGKIEVIETGDKGSAKITTRAKINNMKQDPSIHMMKEEGKTLENNNTGTSISAPQIFETTIGTEFIPKNNENSERVSLTQENPRDLK